MKRVLFFLLLSCWKNKQVWSRGRQLTSWFPSLPPCLTGLTPHKGIPGKQGPGSRDAQRSTEEWAGLPGSLRGPDRCSSEPDQSLCSQEPHVLPLLNLTSSPKGRGIFFVWQVARLKPREDTWLARSRLTCKSGSQDSGWVYRDLLGLRAGTSGERWAGWIDGWVSCCLPGLSVQTKGGEADQTCRLSEPPTPSVPQGQDLSWERAVAATRSSGVLTAGQDRWGQEAAQEEQHHFHGVWGQREGTDSLGRRLPTLTLSPARAPVRLPPWLQALRSDGLKAEAAPYRGLCKHEFNYNGISSTSRRCD